MTIITSRICNRGKFSVHVNNYDRCRATVSRFGRAEV